MSNWGGKRKGAGSGGKREGAGRKPVLKWKNTRLKLGGYVVIEREELGGLPLPPEVWKLVNVQDGHFEFQRTVDGNSEIMTVSGIDYWNGD